MKKFIFGIIFGIDMIIALIIFVIATFFNEEWNWILLGWCIFFSLLPDGDMVLYLIVKKHLAYPSHRRVGHHPIIAIPLYLAFAFGIVRIFNLSEQLFMATALTGLIGHFLHDSTESHGLHWFSPFSWKHYRLTWLGFKPIPDQTWKGYYEAKKAEWSKNTTSEFSGRAEAVPEWQIVVIVILCAISVWMFIVLNLKDAAHVASFYFKNNFSICLLIASQSYFCNTMRSPFSISF